MSVYCECVHSHTHTFLQCLCSQLFLSRLETVCVNLFLKQQWLGAGRALLSEPGNEISRGRHVGVREARAHPVWTFPLPVLL